MENKIGGFVQWTKDGVTGYGRVLKNNDGTMTVRSYKYDADANSLTEIAPLINTEISADEVRGLDKEMRANTNVCERREFRMENLENDGVTIRGYASVFNSDSEDLGGFTERIEAGAFSDVLNDDCRCLYNHDYNMVLGRVSSGTLRLSQDSRGLFYECDLPNTSYARDLAELMKRGDVTQSSFGFFIERDRWEERNGRTYRIIEKVSRLLDVSPVALPAYEEATSEIKRELETPTEAPVTDAIDPVVDVAVDQPTGGDEKSESVDAAQVEEADNELFELKLKIQNF